MVAAWTSWMVFTRVSALIRLQLLHLARPPVAVAQAGMRQGEWRFIERQVVVADDVEVQGARAPLVGAADPPRLPLDLEQGIEQDPRRGGRLQQHHLVDV